MRQQPDEPHLEYFKDNHASVPEATPAAPPPQIIQSLNSQLADIADEHRWRTARLEDGELVLPLHSPHEGHIGLWGAGQAYLLIERGRVASAVAEFKRAIPEALVQENDIGLLARFPVEGLEEKSTILPRWARPVRKPPGGAPPERKRYGGNGQLIELETTSRAYPDKR